MAFKKYKIIGDVAEAFQLRVSREEFVIEIPTVPMPDFLKADIDYVMKNYPYSVSGAAIRETIIFPILKETWKRHDDTLMLWANKGVSCGGTAGASG